jgi:hypothetical protein
MSVVREFISVFNFKLKDSDLKKYDASVKKTLNNLNRFGEGLKSFGRKATLYVSTPLAIAGYSFVKAASDAEEAQNKFNQVFGGLSGQASDFADTLGNAVNRSSIEIKDGMSSFQQFAQGLGVSSEEALDFSKSMQGLSIDFASFNNMSDGEALGRFISALSGSTEVMDKFGINLKVAAIEQELLSMGIKESYTNVSELQKTLARANIIKKVMGRNGAIGDAERTAGSFANQLKGLRAAFKDMSIELGRELLPSALFLVKALKSLIQYFRSLPIGVKRTVLAIGAMAAAVGPLAFALGHMVIGFKALIPLLTSFSTASKFALLPLIKWAAILGSIYLLYDDIKTYLEGGRSVGGKFYDTIIPLAKKFWDILKGMWPDLKKFGGVILEMFGVTLAVVLYDVLAIIYAITKAIQFSTKKIEEFFNWISKYSDIADSLNPFKSTKGLRDKIGSADFKKMVEDSFQAQQLANENWQKLVGSGYQAYYSRPTPSNMNGVTSSGTSNTNNNNNIQINNKVEVNVSSDADPKQIGNEVSTQSGNSLQRLFRQAKNSYLGV